MNSNSVATKPFLPGSLYSRICVLMGLILTVCAMPIQAQEAENPTSFVRFVDGTDQWQGQLQTAILSYQNTAGVTLNLVSAIHIADKSYYQTLNEFFLTQDAVLYELVAEPDERPIFADEQDPDKLLIQSNRGGSPLSFLQRSMARFLDVGFQLELVDYSPSNFRHADMSLTELSEVMQSKNENAFSMFLSLALAQSAAASPANSGIGTFALIQALMAEQQESALKYLLAKELANSEISALSAELEEQLTILGDRNRVALDILSSSLEDTSLKHISLFYGAAHMPGLERSVINELGFVRIGHRWLDAWIIP